jgi:hypothetical protein
MVRYPPMSVYGYLDGIIQSIFMGSGWWYTMVYLWWFEPTPLQNMSSSVGMMTFQYIIYGKKHVPNHQPGVISVTKTTAILGHNCTQKWMKLHG